MQSYTAGMRDRGHKIKPKKVMDLATVKGDQSQGTFWGDFETAVYISCPGNAR